MLIGSTGILVPWEGEVPGQGGRREGGEKGGMEGGKEAGGGDPLRAA